MSRARAQAVVGAEELTAILRPRDGLVVEQESAPGRFEQLSGPFAAYSRRVDVEALPGGRSLARQVVEVRLGIPFFAWLFAVPVHLALRPVRPAAGMPWWGPPQRLDRRAAVVLATLSGLAVVVGYLGALLGLTMT